MKCDLCKTRRATIHLTQKELGKADVKVNLCAVCAKEKGVDDPTGFSLADLILALRRD